MFHTNWTHDIYTLQICSIQTGRTITTYYRYVWYKLHAQLVYRYKLHTGGSWHRVPSTSNSRQWSSERRRCSISGIFGRTDVSSIMKCILRTLVVVTQCSTLAATLLCLACFGLVHTIPNTTCLTAAFAFLSGWIRNKHLILIILSERPHNSNDVYLMSPGGYSCNADSAHAAMRWEHGKCNNLDFMQEQKALPSTVIKLSCTTLSLRIPRPVLSLHRTSNLCSIVPVDMTRCSLTFSIFSCIYCVTLVQN